MEASLPHEAKALVVAGFPLLVVTFPFAFFYPLRIEAYAPAFVFETLVGLFQTASASS